MCLCGGQPAIASSELHSVIFPQVHGLSEDMLEKLDIEDEGKPIWDTFVAAVFLNLSVTSAASPS